MIRRINERHNRQFDDKINGMVNGQSRGIIPKLRYGVCSMSFNGCEAIALYNALVYAEIKTSFSKTVSAMESSRMLFGILGGNPLRFESVSQKLGLKTERIIPQHQNFTSGAYIISFRCKNTLFSPIHTVFCVIRSKKITVYNRYNNSVTATVYQSFSDFIGNRKIISAYAVII